MANLEHLKILAKGVFEWNLWRELNPQISPDLSNVDFSSMNLEGVNFTSSIITGSKFERANLRKARLSKSKLMYTQFREAILAEAHLDFADLTKAYMLDARLEGAYFYKSRLVKTNLSGTYLSHTLLDDCNLTGVSLFAAFLRATSLTGTNLRNAVMIATTLSDVDLSVAKNIDKIRHLGASTIGIDTLYKSQGKIPLSFLRGAGIPDTMIEYANSLIGKPIEYYSCFISYSTQEPRLCQPLVRRPTKQHRPLLPCSRRA